MAHIKIIYASRTGETEAIANLIAEGVRISGHEATVVASKTIKKESELNDCDALVLGSATYHGEMMESMKTLLFLAEKAELEGKVGGAFGSHTHSGEAPGILFDTMANVFQMNMVDLGALTMEERVVVTDDGLHACQQFGKAIAERAG